MKFIADDYRKSNNELVEQIFKLIENEAGGHSMILFFATQNPDGGEDDLIVNAFYKSMKINPFAAVAKICEVFADNLRRKK